jgi:predicted metal-binding membrane protein
MPTGRHAALLVLALRAERTPLILLLILLPLASWSWIVVMARDMYGPMTGASAWMMTSHWNAPHLLLLWAMWAVMMTGMMLPSASPMLLLAGGTARQQTGTGGGRVMYGLASGYLAVWALFSIGATAIQWLLVRLFIVSPMMELTTPAAGAVLLAVAGVYQLTPLKQACLTTCQSPLAFLIRRWRHGAWGGFRMGLEHGAYCVGCCWALMLLLFVGGVMNLMVIAALTAFVAFEKLVPFGGRSAYVSGALLLAAAVWMLLR